jgi:hypothetical protein
MKLPRAAQILLTIVCVAIAAGFGTSSQFYSESLSSAFFAIALVSVVIIQLRVCGLWPDALILIGLTTLLAIVDFRFLHYTPHVMAWLSFFGLNGLLLLSLRAVWSEGESRKLFVMAFVPALLFVTSEWFASNMLDLTERLHPKALDLYLYFFDGSLRVVAMVQDYRGTFLCWSAHSHRACLFRTAYPRPRTSDPGDGRFSNDRTPGHSLLQYFSGPGTHPPSARRFSLASAGP